MSNDLSTTAAYEYTLPAELVAARPPGERDGGRLMLVDRSTGHISHHGIRDFPRFVRAGDRLVRNNTKVLPARLLGQRTETGGAWEGLFLGVGDAGRWRLIGQTRGKLRVGETITIHPAHRPESNERLVLRLDEKGDDGHWLAEPVSVTRPTGDQGDAILTEDRAPRYFAATTESESLALAFQLLSAFGTVPLPSYMGRDLADAADVERYQTVFAERAGSVAAPTAGLHFTPELCEACSRAGGEWCDVTLHVGLGTFRPIAVDRLDEHRMHSEWCDVTESVAADIREARYSGHRCVAIGTTAVRTLESASRSGSVTAYQGETNLFIRQPYRFQTVDALFTNFHLPRSTLLVLVCTFAGRELILKAYHEAIAERYRFYSYGDAMLIV